MHPTRRAERGVGVPLAGYLGFALVVPLLNGGWAEPGFWGHAAVVSAVAVTLAGAWCFAGRVLRRLLRG